MVLDISKNKIKLLSDEQKSEVNQALQEIVDYRKSGLSLNHIIGCPLNCAYCVRHFWDNFEMKVPHMIASDEDAVKTLVEHKYFTAHKTPLQLFNRATDPFLPNVKPHTFNVLKLLDQKGFKNSILIITRYKVTPEDMEKLENIRNLRVTLLFTYSGINGTKIEPLPPATVLNSIDTSFKLKKRIRTILYWRPIVPGWNDSNETIRHVLEISQKTDAIAYTGLFFREQQEKYFESVGIEIPYENPHRRKILTSRTEEKILKFHKDLNIKTPIFRKTSCAVAYSHELPDYNGHYGIPDICDICPIKQKRICSKNHESVTNEEFSKLLSLYEYDTEFEINSGHVWTHGLGEERRYHLQHTLGFQVWDRDWPHLPKQHGRAPVGYEK